ncbi:MAG TPA: hypothetical protein VLN46_01020, partial [Gillisia sp.]|nr:hypothetical protein [Gillisia sp.]
MNQESIFNISSSAEFETVALEVFRHQYQNTPVYSDFCRFLKKDLTTVRTFRDIPFLPIEFFKTHKVLSNAMKPQAVFTSSGTTGQSASKHLVGDISLYEQSFHWAFKRFYGEPEEWVILALLPSY